MNVLLKLLIAKGTMEHLYKSNTLILLLIGLFYCQEAYAYFDPGNGGYLLSALAGYVGSLIVLGFAFAGS